MSYCQNCSAQLGNDEKFCTSCGSAVAQNTNAPSSVAKPKSSSKNTLFAGIALVLVAVIVYAVFFSGGGAHKSEKAVVNKLLKSMVSYDAKGMLECFPPEMYKEYSTMILLQYGNWKAASADMKRSENYDDYKSYKVTDIVKYSSSEVKEYREDYEYLYDNASKISAVSEVTIEDPDDDWYSEEITVIKIGGKWYVSPNDLP